MQCPRGLSFSTQQIVPGDSVPVLDPGARVEDKRTVLPVVSEWASSLLGQKAPAAKPRLVGRACFVSDTPPNLVLILETYKMLEPAPRRLQMSDRHAGHQGC